jgi:restriction system protein
MNLRRANRMKKRSNGKKKKIRLVPFLFVVFVGYLGWRSMQSVEGIALAIMLYFILLGSFKIWLKTRKGSKLRKAGMKEIDQMTGEEFEQFLGELFKRRGFKITYTSTSGDYGADLILGDGDEKIAVQAKRYSGNVGVKAVQEIIGAVKMYEANEAWVVTNSYFTKQAIKLAEINDVYLIDRDELIDMILGKA